MKESENKLSTGKKVGAGALIVATIAGLGFGVAEHSDNSDLAADMQTMSEELAVAQADQLKLGELNTQIEAGELVKPSDVDITSDNMAAVKAAIDGLESVELDEESGKVLLVSPNVIPDAEVAYSLDNLEFGKSVEAVINHNDLSKLFKGDIEFDGDDLKIKEQVELLSDLKVAFSGSSEFSKSFGPLPYLATMSRASMTYGIEFVDVPDWSKVSIENPLEVDFLGKPLIITEHNGDSMSVMIGSEVILSGKESIEVEGKVVTLENVGSDAVSVSVDGVSKMVPIGDDKEVNGLKVLVKSVIDRPNLEECSAVMVIGEDSFKTVTDGDGFDAKDSSDAEWLWIVSEDKVGIKHNKILNEADEAYAPGTSLSLPNDYVKMEFKCISEPKTELTMGFDEIEIGEEDETVLTLKTDSADGLSVDFEGDTMETGEVFFDGKTFYAKEDGDLVEVSNVKLSESQLGISQELVIDGLDIDIDLGEEKFTGLNLGETDLSNRDEDTLTQFGSVLKGVDDLEDTNELVLSIPDEQEMCKLAFA